MDTNQTIIIFNKWSLLRTKIGKNKPQLTDSRKKFICNLLSNKPFKDVDLILDYFNKSNDDYIKFMRTEHGGRYTGLEYIFRETKFADKLSRAKVWKKKTKHMKIKDVYLPYTIGKKGGE